jgi:hypothetical protein
MLFFFLIDSRLQFDFNDKGVYVNYRLKEFQESYGYNIEKALSGSVAFGNNFIFIILNLSKNEYERSLLSKIYHSSGSVF